MQTRHTNTISTKHANHRSVRHVNTNLHHRGSNQNIVLAVTERGHHLILVILTHLPMQHSAPHALKRALRQRVKQGLHRRDRTLVVALHVRGNNKDAPTQPNLRQRPRYKLAIRLDSVGRVTPNPTRHNRQTALGLIRQRNHLNVTIQHLSGSARNRRRRHHQHVRARHTISGAHLNETRPVLHAKLLLLIHHHETQVTETHRLLQQASRPHSHANNTVSNVTVEALTLRARRRPPGIKQRHATRNACALARDADRLIQLFRQDSRRRKNRDLPARRDSGHNRERSRQRLTGTHVTNQQRHVSARIGGRLQQAARRIDLSARHRKRQ